MVVQDKFLFWARAFTFLFIYGPYHYYLDYGLGTIFTVVGIGLAIVALMILYGGVLRYFSYQKKWNQNILPLNEIYSGKLIGSLDTVLDWIDECWPSLDTICDELPGMKTAAISCSLEKFKTLLWFDMSTSNAKSRIYIFLSAVVPGLESGGYGDPMHTVESGRIRMDLERNGFEVFVKEEGIRLSATPVLVSEMRNKPDMISRYVPPILDQLVQLARAYRCRP